MNLICAICLERFTSNCEVLSTPCGHLFHNPCLAKAFTGVVKTCPTCRHVCVDKIHKVYLQCDSESVQRSAQQSAQQTAQQSAQQSAQGSAQQSAQQRVTGTDLRHLIQITAQQSAQGSAQQSAQQSVTGTDLHYLFQISAENRNLCAQQRPVQRARDGSWRPGMPLRPRFVQPPVTPQQRYQTHPDVIEYGWSDYY